MNGDGSSLNKWTDTIGSLGGTASGLIGAFNKPKTVVQQTGAAPATPWGLIAGIGGAVLLLVVVLVVFAGGHK
jgi:hypothetical protein